MNDRATPEQGRAGGLPARITLLLVVAVFVVPIGVAWWYALVAPPDDGIHLLNHGAFLEPPLDIRHDDVMAPLRGIPLAPGEWAVLYFTAGSCEAACAEAVTTLDAIRTVIGRDATRLRIGALADAASPAMTVPHLIADPAARVRLAAATTAAAGGNVPALGVVFLDWRGQIMMFFADLSDPAGIKADLKRLLRGSRTS
ncbi:MAG: hypothetical protein AB7Q81_13120 [Gammaproteobacteria bacterium]